MTVLALVVDGSTPLDELGESFPIHDCLRASRDGQKHILDEIDEPAPIAIGHGDERLARLAVKG